MVFCDKLGIDALSGITALQNAVRLFGLDPESRKHVGKYSLGMRQRLGIAQAIMEHPKLLVLDEPMNGLDNNGVREMRTLPYISGFSRSSRWCPGKKF